MADIIPAFPIDRLSGKTNKHDNHYYRTARHSGKVFAIGRRENYHFNYSEEQAENRRQFGIRSRRLRAWYVEQQSSPTPSPIYQQLMASFLAQSTGPHCLDNAFDYMLRHYDRIFEEE